jgi:FMN phosphatase YigB (HAD superfamily)
MKNYLNEIKLSIKIGLMVLIGLSAFEASAEIVQASSVNDIKTYTSQFDGKDTIVFFDLDYVLITPQDRVLRYAGEENNYRSKHFQAILKNFQGKEIALVKDKEVPMAEYLISQILFTSKFELVSPDMPNFINELDKKMTVVGFTANSSGKYGIVQNEAELHLSRLNSLGYHFKDNGDLLKGEFPECISRVIFANKADKGKVLLGFLKQLNKNYKNIIFVDDRLKNLISVQNILKDYKINYLGIHYTELKDKNEVLNQDIADKQFEVLARKHIWLSDEEVEAMLNIKPSRKS